MYVFPPPGGPSRKSVHPNPRSKRSIARFLNALNDGEKKYSTIRLVSFFSRTLSSMIIGGSVGIIHSVGSQVLIIPFLIRHYPVGHHQNRYRDLHAKYPDEDR